MESITARTSRRPSRVKAVVLTALLICIAPLACGQARGDTVTEPQPGTVLITGANRGIGLELARQYAAAGWRVIGTARRPDAAHELHEITQEVLQLDVTEQVSVDGLARDLADRPIDVLINNAGIQPLMWKLEEVDIGAFTRSLNVNTVGPVRIVRALLPNLRSGEHRKVVNITTNLSSIAGNTDGGFYGYRESKAALNMFTRSLAAELGPEGFICVVLHPGWVRTDLGGPDAPLNVTESVAGMRSVIDGLVPADNGSFQTYSGERMDW